MRFLILLAAILLSGCGQAVEPGTKTLPLKTIVFDGCQYLVYENSSIYSNNYSFSITHKGNCNNPFHWKDTPAEAPAIVPETIPPEMEVPAIEPLQTRPTI